MGKVIHTLILPEHISIQFQDGEKTYAMGETIAQKEVEVSKSEGSHEKSYPVHIIKVSRANKLTLDEKRNQCW